MKVFLPKSNEDQVKTEQVLSGVSKHWNHVSIGCKVRLPPIKLQLPVELSVVAHQVYALITINHMLSTGKGCS